jgi:hypothetical protein
MNADKATEIARKVMELSDKCKTMDDYYHTLHAIAFTVGGMVSSFKDDEREQVMIELTQAVVNGFMTTITKMGQTSSLEMIVGMNPEK